MSLMRLLAVLAAAMFPAVTFSGFQPLYAVNVRKCP